MSLNMRNDRPASESVDERLEGYRATPKKYFLSTEDQLVDAGQPLLGRHAARHARMVLPGRVRECRIRRVGEGQGTA